MPLVSYSGYFHPCRPMDLRSAGFTEGIEPEMGLFESSTSQRPNIGTVVRAFQSEMSGSNFVRGELLDMVRRHGAKPSAKLVAEALALRMNPSWPNADEDFISPRHCRHRTAES